MSIPITNGTGQSSVAAEAVSGLQYQQVEVYGRGGASVLAVNPDGSLNASIIGTPNINVSGSVVGFQGGAPWAVTNVGSIISTNVGSIITLQIGSVITTNVGSIVAVLQGSSILAVPVGSVITVPQSSSVLAVPVGSVITIFGQTPSIVGTYAEDSGHTQSDKGLFVVGVRNDTLSSITSADNDYSPFGVGPTGAVTAHDAPINKWIQGTADMRVVLGASVTAIGAQGASVFTYIREIQVANMGSASVLVTFAGGLGSILGYTIAPAGGGSNFITRLKTGENSAFTASISGTASVLVSAQGFTAKI